MDTLQPPRLYSTKVPLVVGGLTIILSIAAFIGVIVIQVLVGAPEMMAAMNELQAEAERSQRGVRAGGASHEVIAALAGDPSDLADRLRAAGFEDDPDMKARRRSRAFGSWMAALRYQDETSTCSVLLEGTTSNTIEFVEVEATFTERVGAVEVARVIGPTLSILDPRAEPSMIIAAIHDGAGNVGQWYAERGPRDGGGMSVVLVTGSTRTVSAE